MIRGYSNLILVLNVDNHPLCAFKACSAYGNTAAFLLLHVIHKKAKLRSRYMYVPLLHVHRKNEVRRSSLFYLRLRFLVFVLHNSKDPGTDV